MTEAANDPARTGLRWEQAELKGLIRGVASGLTVAELARRHERTRNAVGAAAMRLLPDERRPASRSQAVTTLARYLREQDDIDYRGLAERYFTSGRRTSAPRVVGVAERSPVPPDSEKPTAIGVADTFNLVAEAVHGLQHDRDREVLRLRLGIDGDPLTLAEIGQSMGFSRERARQLQNRGLGSLARQGRTNDSPGRMIGELLAAGESNANATVAFLLEASTSFETSVSIAATFILRAGGYPARLSIALARRASTTARERLEAMRLDEDLLRRQSAKTQGVEATIAHWLDHADWPEALSPAPATTTLTSPRRFPDAEFSGAFPSRKLGRLVNFESSVEYKVLSILERSDQIAHYLEQPCAIPYSFDGISRRYYPDIFAVTTEGRGLLIEVKPLVNMAISVNRAKADAARGWAHSRGWGWLSLDDRGTFADLAARQIPSAGRARLDQELRARGRLTWRDVLALRARHGLSAVDIAAYVVQSDARLTLEPAYLIVPPSA